MHKTKGFIYSLDSYISVIIALTSVYLLVSYSYLETNYVDYYQAKLLTLDGLRIIVESENPGNQLSKLDYLIPEKYSYQLTVLDSKGDVINIGGRGDVEKFKKIKVSSSIYLPVFNKDALSENPNRYKSCKGSRNICSSQVSPLPTTQLDFRKYILTVAI